VTAGSSFNLQKLADAFKIAFDPERSPAEYRLCIHELKEREGGKGGGAGGKARAAGTLDAKPRVLGYWCFHSGAAMRALKAAGVRSVLLTSGTLSPLGSFADELGLPFEYKLENPHVIDPQAQLLIGTFTKGPSGHELTSSYAQRESEEAKRDLGNAIINFARLVPQGVLVFFPSYSAMQSAHAAWALASPDGGPSVLERLRKLKTLVVEPRDASECAAAVQTFQDAVQSSLFRGTGGAMLLAVCRGKLSEGVDFADSACRGVVITGLPLPPAFDAKVELKRQYLDQRRAAAARGSGLGGSGASGMLSGEAWYHQQAMRAVNQAVGRVIRHRNDFGAVMLCESRFAKSAWVDGLSLWLRPHVKQFSSFGQGYPALQRFFKLRSELASTASGDVGTVELEEGESVHAATPCAPLGPRPLPALPPPAPTPSLHAALASSSSKGARYTSAAAAAAAAAADAEEGGGAGRVGLGGGGLGRSGAVVEAAWAAAVSSGGEGRYTDEPSGAQAMIDDVAGGDTKEPDPPFAAAAAATGAAGSAAAAASTTAQRRAAWAPPREDWRLHPGDASIRGGIRVGSGAGGGGGGDQLLARPAEAAAAAAASTSAGSSAAPVTAVDLLNLARTLLTAEEYARFMALVRALLALPKPSDGAHGSANHGAHGSASLPMEVVPHEMQHQMRSLFGMPGREELRARFVRFVPKHLPHVRQVLMALQVAASATAPLPTKRAAPGSHAAAAAVAAAAARGGSSALLGPTGPPALAPGGTKGFVNGAPTQSSSSAAAAHSQGLPTGLAAGPARSVRPGSGPGYPPAPPPTVPQVRPAALHASAQYGAAPHPTVPQVRPAAASMPAIVAAAAASRVHTGGAMGHAGGGPATSAPPPPVTTTPGARFVPRAPLSALPSTGSGAARAGAAAGGAAAGGAAAGGAAAGGAASAGAASGAGAGAALTSGSGASPACTGGSRQLQAASAARVGATSNGVRGSSTADRGSSTADRGSSHPTPKQPGPVDRSAPAEHASSAASAAASAVAPKRPATAAASAAAHPPESKRPRTALAEGRGTADAGDDDDARAPKPEGGGGGGAGSGARERVAHDGAHERGKHLMMQIKARLGDDVLYAQFKREARAHLDAVRRGAHRSSSTAEQRAAALSGLRALHTLFMSTKPPALVPMAAELVSHLPSTFHTEWCMLLIQQGGAAVHHA